LNGAIVAAQMTVSVVLLIASGLLLRSVANLQSIDLGFEPDGLSFVRMRLPEGTYANAEAKERLFEQLIQQTRRLPGVVAAAAASAVPWDGGLKTGVEVPGGIRQPGMAAFIQFATDDYFTTSGRRVLRGRLLSNEDLRLGRAVGVVNEAFVRSYLPQRDFLNRRVMLDALTKLHDVRDSSVEIVGVVADAKNRGVRNPSFPEIFVPSSVTASYGRALLIRTAPGRTLIDRSVRIAVGRSDPRIVVTETGRVGDLLARFEYAEPRFELAVLGAFGCVGLLLVAFGVFGVVGYSVSRETRSIGIRMALGASQYRVIATVVRRSLRPICIGVVVGLSVSYLATRILANQLWNVGVRDPLAFGGSAATVLFVGFAASLIAARRVTQVDPVIALREE